VRSNSGHRSISHHRSTKRRAVEVIDLERVRRRDLLGRLIHEYRLAA
jgi:hypothetical protein